MKMKFSEFVQLEEKLMVFGKKAYPKFNNVLILAGGAGSGKGFVTSKLVGLEGITLDVDRVKELAMASTKLAGRIKAETGHDISKFDLKKPENVSTLHNLLSDVYKTTKNMDKRVFNGVLAAPEDRKPNLIFDVTLKDMGKMAQIAKQVRELGYNKENVHIVWVMNDINVAMKQNAERSRTVPVEILVATHEGASMTFKNLMAMGEGARSYADGDWYIAFNKIGVDSSIAKSGKGGSYVKEANYIRVKQQGKAPMKATELDKQIVNKISDYIPNPETWAMVMKK
ncbi:hypothetical protein F485_gp019 [Aeromonas phage CC2]|uniref:Zeta toxin domain-containing protein n=1 Tax=Aeromonas phage CC2 TaxID=1204516 RepID=I6XLP6_9CAUD|nr:hypothetical protein F485_gp019 [Aeromonas phage CC2]AFN39434.1 hypothetical protein CC2_367 [Aeromonas phage CC2]